MSERREGSKLTEFSAADVEVLDKRTGYSGYFSLNIYRLRHKLFAGGWGAPMQREIFDRGHAVAAVLYDPGTDVLVLIQQFRTGALIAAEQPHLAGAFSPWLIEIVAGIIDDGETPDAVMQREAVEEAGCAVRELRQILPILTTPGGSSESVVLYYGLVDAPAAGGLHGLDEEHEDIRVITASPEEVWKWMDQGRIVNGPALVGLQWFRIHEKALRSATGAGATACG